MLKRGADAILDSLTASQNALYIIPYRAIENIEIDPTPLLPKTVLRRVFNLLLICIRDNVPRGL